ncbi:MAG: GAK system CofD-like protein [Planctomycetota bacterium]
MTIYRLSRPIRIPDPLRIARYQRAPELGPKILFFSGGTALRDVCVRLIEFTHNTTHLITPFDSGGSSASLRKGWNMLAVGDIRNRIMALADRTVQGNPEVTALFAWRFPRDTHDDEALHLELDRMIRGRHQLIASVPEPMQQIIRNHLGYFRESMPEAFDLRGASIGNLILVGGYVNNGRQIDPVIFLFSRLVKARGTVRPTAHVNVHLVAELEDGTRLVGQHTISGKEATPIRSPITRLYLTRGDDRETTAHATDSIQQLIRDAELICYPPGSLFTSVIANLLPAGVAQAVRGNGCPRVFIPNTAGDPEQFGMTLADSVAQLLRYLRAGCGSEEIPARELVNAVVIDSVNGVYAGNSVSGEIRRIEDMGVHVFDTALVTPGSTPLLDPARLSHALLSMI